MLYHEEKNIRRNETELCCKSSEGKIFSENSWHRTLENDLVGKWQETKKVKWHSVNKILSYGAVNRKKKNKSFALIAQESSPSHFSCLSCKCLYIMNCLVSFSVIQSRIPAHALFALFHGCIFPNTGFSSPRTSLPKTYFNTWHFQLGSMARSAHGFSPPLLAFCQSIYFL